MTGVLSASLLVGWLSLASAAPDGLTDRADRVRALAADGHVGQAETLALQWLDEHPDDPAAWRLLAAARIDHDLDQARLALLRAKEIAPTDPDTLLALARLEERATTWGGARALYEQAAAHGADPTVARLGAARTAWIGRDADALERAESLVADHPESVDGWLLRAKLGDPTQVLARAAEVHPDDPRIAHERAVHALLAGQPSDVEAPAGSWLARARDCVSAGTLTPDDLAVLEPWRGVVVVVPFGSGPALEALARRSDCGLAHQTVARFHTLSGDDDAALRALERAARLLPDDADLAAALGTALFRERKRAEALPWLLAALDRRPADVPLVLLAAEAADAAGQPHTARSTLEAALDRHPADADLRLALADRLPDPGARLDLLIDGLREAPLDDDLLAAALELAGPLQREHHVHDAVLWPRAVAERVARRTDAVGAVWQPAQIEVDVFRQDEIEKRRAALENRLVSMGYGPGRRVKNGTHFAARRLRASVTLHDDGSIDIQRSGFLPSNATTTVAIDPTDPSRIVAVDVRGGKRYNARQMGPLRWQVLDEARDELTAWTAAIGRAQTMERLERDLPDALDALWLEGVPMNGTGFLTDPSERKRALLKHWATRTCTNEGMHARTVVARYLINAVMESEVPVTADELDATNDERNCGAPLHLGPLPE